MGSLTRSAAHGAVPEDYFSYDPLSFAIQLYYPCFSGILNVFPEVYALHIAFIKINIKRGNPDRSLGYFNLDRLEFVGAKNQYLIFF
jgi:hypothetical protein